MYEKKYFDKLLFRINKIYTEKINENLKEFNVTWSEARFLLRLCEKTPMTQDELAKVSELNNATVTRALERLEKKEYIKRRNNPKDKRSKLVFITDNGKHIIRQVLNKHTSFKEEMFFNFTNEEYENLIELLNKFHENLKIKD